MLLAHFLVNIKILTRGYSDISTIFPGVFLTGFQLKRNKKAFEIRVRYLNSSRGKNVKIPWRSEAISRNRSIIRSVFHISRQRRLQLRKNKQSRKALRQENVSGQQNDNFTQLIRRGRIPLYKQYEELNTAV